jgi:hypothetical protein
MLFRPKDRRLMRASEMLRYGNAIYAQASTLDGSRALGAAQQQKVRIIVIMIKQCLTYMQ